MNENDENDLINKIAILEQLIAVKNDGSSDLMKENEKLINKQNELMKENEKLMNKQIELIKENEKLMSKQIELMKENGELEKKRSELINDITNLKYNDNKKTENKTQETVSFKIKNEVDSNYENCSNESSYNLNNEEKKYILLMLDNLDDKEQCMILEESCNYKKLKKIYNIICSSKYTCKNDFARELLKCEKISCLIDNINVHAHSYYPKCLIKSDLNKKLLKLW